MKISTNGLNLVKQFEGCRLTAYKCVSTEQYYTIGYGHYGADVSPNMVITQEQADSFLRDDIEKFEKYVNQTNLPLNQNQFDALVSFTYNCGNGCLKKLIKNRTLSEIADALPLYNKSGGKILKGLVRRRAEEQKLFNTPVTGQGTTEPVQPIPQLSFKIGKNYTLQYNMNVRKTPNGEKKTFLQLTTNAKSHAVKQPDGSAVLRKGTVVTCQAVKALDGVTWVKIPSGWVCGIAASGKIYVK